MAINFKLYTDSGLTTPVSGPITFEVAEDGSSGWQVQQLFFGSVLASRRCQRTSDPGVDNLIFYFNDTVGGSDPSVDDVAFSLDGISWETAGDPLDLGIAELDSGVANAVEVWVRGKVWAGATPATYQHIQIITDELREIAIP